jgi:hypothetical protein
VVNPSASATPGLEEVLTCLLPDRLGWGLFLGQNRGLSNGH